MLKRFVVDDDAADEWEPPPKQVDTRPDETIANLPHGSGSDLRVTWCRERGHWNLQVRVWAKNGTRAFPTASGVTLRLDKVHAMAAILARAASEVEPGRDGTPMRVFKKP